MIAAHKTRWLDAQEQQVWAQLSTMILRLQPVLSAQLQREFVFDRLTRAQARQLGAISQRILDGLPPDDSWPSTAQS